MLHPQGKIIRVSSIDWKREKLPSLELTQSDLGDEEMKTDHPTQPHEPTEVTLAQPNEPTVE